MAKIERLQQIGKVFVPISVAGNYCDWRGFDPDSPEAEPLSSPYGPAHFQIGDELIFATLDFIELPDGWFNIRVVANADLFPMEDTSSNHAIGEVMGFAWEATERLLEALKREGTDHLEDRYHADAYYFLRALGRYIGLAAYADMTDGQLRWGRGPGAA